MNKILLLSAVLIFITFASCTKDNSLPSSSPLNTNYFKGSFAVTDGDIVFKSKGDPESPNAYDRTWTLMARHSLNYGNADFVIVTGKEFITKTTPYAFWHTAGNNPITLGADKNIDYDFTPDEDLRLITESKLKGTNGPGSGVVAYLGMLDFHPSHNNFPLKMTGYRLGDVLQINTDQVTKLQGGENLRFKVIYTLKPINLDKTKAKLTLSGKNRPEDGTAFTWDDIEYDQALPSASIDVPVGRDLGDMTLLNIYDGKVTGNIILEVTEVGNPGSKLDVPVNGLALSAGQGLKLVLKTDKVGWFNGGRNSSTHFEDTDISISAITVIIN
jgi:hypothetical protein